MKQVKKGRCALCGLEAELQLSHIIPHFVGKRLMKTSIGNIRYSNNPNLTPQDIEKHYLLCHNCEELFSAKERAFANFLFYPWQDKKERTFKYDINLSYFIVSLSWRSLYLDLADLCTNEQLEKDKLLILFNAEREMRNFLLGNGNVPYQIENHILFLDRIADAFNLETGKFPSVAMHRSLSSYTSCYEDTLYTISNLMGILIVTFYAKGKKEKWINTNITYGDGIIRAENQYMESVAGNDITHWMDTIEQSQKNLSTKQQEKIKSKLKEMGDDIKDYPIYQDFIDDSKLNKN